MKYLHPPHRYTRRRATSRLVIHHTATPNTRETTADQVRRWHVDGNGWLDMGYHFLIRRDGRLELGRPIWAQGAHASGHNADTIGIALAGTGPDFTPAQLDTLYSVITMLREVYPITSVLGHRELGRTECPGFEVRQWLAARA
jgi:N-acetylmuramoyl-L-alanine amidase